MSFKNKSPEFVPARCAECSREPFYRMLHLLKFPDERSAAAHLQMEFGTSRQADGFIDSELKWRRFIIDKYSNHVDSEGNKMPVWLAFAMSKAKVTRLPRGWRIVPRPPNEPTPSEIRERVEETPWRRT